jgi:hypothetical protein
LPELPFKFPVRTGERRLPSGPACYITEQQGRAQASANAAKNRFLRVPILIYKLGRLLQFAALIILPVAIAGNVADRLDLRESLTLSTMGCGIFALGWLLQQGAKPR